ncbi:MAG: deoxyribodipyrimidine photo-lyase [Alphaproteobacteria bacterium]|nr:deoxyribodipyrimidine photo-lyase [Alphaproteobacteria bacterium]
MKPPSFDTPSIVWFSNDLRLGDHRALTRAAARGPVVPLYIHDDSTPPMGGAAAWALHQALHALGADLAARGLPLVLRRGKALDILRDVIAATGARHVTWSRRYEPAVAARDADIASALREDGIETSTHSGFLLFEPESIRTGAGTMFKVYTPFSRACFAAPPPERPLPVPQNLRGVDGVKGDTLDALKLVPRTAQWPRGLAQAWDIGEAAAQDRLRDFTARALTGYTTDRDRPDIDGTSRLSPHLHIGTISPRQIWHAIMRHGGGEKYLQEILWRDFSWHLLTQIPDFITEPLQKSFARFPWRDDPAGLRAWQQGMTGYPIVDAGMRQLWQTGWMHNRVRMIAASFLVKDLLIDWRQGAAWFADTLVDADLGSNTASWQWVAGCGADAAPYFRIFNPTLQGAKFDPRGDYVRRFIPELARLDARYIHEPWKAPADMLARAGVQMGKTYPFPVLDHAHARQRALAALKFSKSEAGQPPESADLFD